MKSLIGFLVVVLVALFLKIGFFSYDPPTLYYNRLGLIKKQMRVWNDTIAITSATPVINVSSAGFGTIVDVQPQIIQASPSLSTFTWCNVTSFTTSAVTLFLAQQNNATVAILGINVLSGSPLSAPTVFTGMFVDLRITGY